MSDKEPATDLLIKTGKRTKQAGYFCAAGLEIDQTKGGPDALHPVPHSSSLLGNRWRDDPRLRHCSLDAEHLATSIIFGARRVGSQQHLRMSWRSEPGVSCRILGRLKTRQEKTSEVWPPSEVCAPRLTLSQGGVGLTPTERRGYKNDSHSLMVVRSKYSFEFG